MIVAKINDLWELELTEDRAAFHAERPDWERARLASMHEHLEPGMIVYDVGAECGDFSALYGTWGCEVVMIEPQPAYWPSIKAHWDYNDLYHPAGMFVGFCDANGDARPTTPEWPVAAYGKLVAEPGFRHLAQDDSTPRTTIDRLASMLAPPDAITIDVEGSELRVLYGALATLRDRQPLLWVSVHKDREWMKAHYPGEDLVQITRTLEVYGYRGTELADEHELHTFWEPT